MFDLSIESKEEVGGLSGKSVEPRRLEPLEPPPKLATLEPRRAPPRVPLDEADETRLGFDTLSSKIQSIEPLLELPASASPMGSSIRKVEKWRNSMILFLLYL